MQCFGLTIRQNKLHSRESNAEAKILPRHFIFIRLYMLKIVVMSCAQVLTRVVRRYMYAGLRREEILALQWDSVYLDTDAPYLTVRRAWHTEHNRPVILTELKTKAAERNIPLPDRLAECLKAAKKKSTSDYVIANQDGEPLSYTQFKRLWQYIVTRTAKPRIARKLVDGKYVKYVLYPKLGEKARNNGHVVYSLDFDVTPHMLRHTYITNLIHASVDPKTVQYLAGHESSKITMDIYAKVKYNKPEQLAGVLSGAFAEWDGGEYEAAQS